MTSPRKLDRFQAEDFAVSAFHSVSTKADQAHYSSFAYTLEVPLIDPNKIASDTIVGKLIRLPLKLVPTGLDVRIVSGPNRGMRWRTGSSVHGCWLGTYESDKVDILRRFVKPGMVAYDIGANAGYYTLLLSRLVGPSGRVYAFEPFPENVLNLIHHVSMNGLANCSVVAAALSDATSVAGFQSSMSNSMGSLVAGDTLLRVPTFRIDDLAAHFGFPPPDFVKMDVEGAEESVLNGASRVLKSRASVWFVALHGPDVARRTVQILEGFGFIVRDMDGRKVDEASVTTLSEMFAERSC